MDHEQSPAQHGGAVTLEQINLKEIQLGDTGLRPIAMDYLFEGMAVNEDIYNFDGKLLLLSKGITITEGILEGLRRFNSENRNINVYMDTYNMLIGHSSGPERLGQAYLERSIGYDRVKEDMEAFLSVAKNTGAISKTQVEGISDRVTKQLQTVDHALLFQCIHAQKSVSEYLRRHSVNVSILNGLMGGWLELSQEKVDELVLSGLVHDVGKTRLPAEILDAPRRLTATEYEVVKMHPLYADEMLSEDPSFSQEVRLAARHHHERVNGSGYPDRLHQQDIDLFARITAVSDIYDAMVTKRSYKGSNSPFLILSRLADQQFSELDTRLVKVFTDNMPKKLIGKQVVLSDGSVGTVRYLMTSDLAYPLVEVNGTVIKTNERLYCKGLVGELS